MRILDTHLHLVYPDRLVYPWLAGAPALNRPWSVEAYFAEAEPLGIASALHMEVDVAEVDQAAETALVLGLEPRVIGAVAACRPEHADFPAALERLQAIPGVRGLRRILHESPDDLSASARFTDNIRRIGPTGLSFDLCVQARQLPVGRALAERCPDVSFVLDHCGNPPIATGDLDTWRADIAAIAALPNVAGKISGIVNHAAAGWTTEDLRPVVEHMVACFGWDRLVWGSDHPVATLGGGLTAWVEAVRTIVAGCSEDEQARLFHRNAERIYRLG